MTTLPPDLARDVATVRKALHGAPAGPDLVEAREAHERLVKALEGARARAEAWQAKGVRFEQLQRAVLALGARVRDFVGRNQATGRTIGDDYAEEDLMEAVYDAEEKAT